MPPLPNCTALTRNGSPCGRKVADGSNPPLCHVHQGKLSPLIPTQVDELALLQKLARDNDPQVRLRAIDRLLKIKERETDCPKCAERAERDRKNDQFIDRATPDQFRAIGAALYALRRIRAEVLGEPAPRDPNAPPPAYTPPEAAPAPAPPAPPVRTVRTRRGDELVTESAEGWEPL